VSAEAPQRHCDIEQKQQTQRPAYRVQSVHEPSRSKRLRQRYSAAGEGAVSKSAALQGAKVAAVFSESGDAALLKLFTPG
jgi:hypothetical protein